MAYAHDVCCKGVKHLSSFQFHNDILNGDTITGFFRHTMVKQSKDGLAGIRARQIPGSIRFLRALGVPATRLAGIFSESADNMRHIDSRSYKKAQLVPKPTVLEKDDVALLDLTAEERGAEARRQIQGLRLRSKQDFDQVEQSIWAIFQNHKSVGLEQGYEVLFMMLATVGNARHGRALRIRLLIEEKLAWFALPLDNIARALHHAERAMELALTAFRESAGDRDYLLHYGESALIASICLQKTHKPEEAFAFIKAADDACIARGELPGSEHLRQRGASFMHMGAGYDGLAEKSFIAAPKRMIRKNEAEHPVDLAMNGLRQQAFIDPVWGWEKSLELTSEVKAAYGAQSMQYGVAAKSAALVGLKLATAETTEIALQLLDGIFPPAPGSVHHILSITPSLKLSPEDRDRWLRFAMNEIPLPPCK